MTDATHDPRTDWCACEPNSMDRCDYRMLADAVIEHLNPPDGDEAEVAICISAIQDIAGFAASLICSCARIEDGGRCPRCAVLGQHQGKRVDR
jgi:hypothetical protein